MRNEKPDYDATHINFLETLWGEGFLSPGGANEVDLIIGGVDLNQKKILDFGCGCGGAILHIAEKYSASELMGVDIEESVITRATRLASTKSLERLAKFKLIERGQLPFAENSFDVVFSKDALISSSSTFEKTTSQSILLLSNIFFLTPLLEAKIIFIYFFLFQLFLKLRLQFLQLIFL